MKKSVEVALINSTLSDMTGIDDDNGKESVPKLY